MADLHIEDFYRDTALIWLRLYKVFPRRENLYVEDICGPDTPDEYGLPSPRYLNCFSTLVWLGEQNYLRYIATVRQEALDQAVLSQKSLLLLSARSEMPWFDPPASAPTNDTTHIARLRQAIGSGSSNLVHQTVHHLLDVSRQFD